MAHSLEQGSDSVSIIHFQKCIFCISQEIKICHGLLDSTSFEKQNVMQVIRYFSAFKSSVLLRVERYYGNTIRVAGPFVGQAVIRPEFEKWVC